AHSRLALYTRRIHSIVATATLLASSCERQDPASDYSDLGNFDSTAVSILKSGGDTVRLKVEVASTDDQKQLGLMERRDLPDARGMLFVYDSVQEATSAFWMFRTRIPLDIVFIDSVGKIASLKSMVPCESPNPEVCPTYPA